MKGSTTPRLTTKPLPGRRRASGSAECPCGCGLSRETTHGFDVIDWAAEVLGIPLHPWQRWLLVHALELDETCTRYRHKIVLVLVARQNGKTLVKMVLTLWRLYVQGIRLAVGTAQDLSQAREVMNEGLVPMMLDNETLRERFEPDREDQADRVGIWHKTLNDEFIRLDSTWIRGRAVPPHGPRYLIKALNRKAGRGLWNVGEVNIDELREQTDFMGWSSISKVVNAAKNAQIWCMSNAGDASSLLLNHLRAVALAGTNEAMFVAEWSAPDGCELDDEKAWAQANPSLGYPGGPTGEGIRSDMRTDPPAVFRTEVLCQFVDSLVAAVDMPAWSGCADPSVLPDGPRSALVVDVCNDLLHASAVAATVLPDGRVRLEVVGEWESPKAARRALPDLRKLLSPKVLGWFPSGPGAVFDAAMKQQGGVPIRGQSSKAACMTFADYVKARQVLQPGSEVLDVQVARTSKVGTEKSWEFARGPEPTQAAWAAAGALLLALERPRPRPSTRKVLLPNVEEA